MSAILFLKIKHKSNLQIHISYIIQAINETELCEDTIPLAAKPKTLAFAAINLRLFKQEISQQNFEKRKKNISVIMSPLLLPIGRRVSENKSDNRIEKQI
ncbi:CLUMA_CG003366, isoform A [Clunio marinus]|uniref:CLUMA_CG003366, isoform A n=1 Tax=Clunio marinus TaxID=568069 RepID=A0A1J1HN86_9DIPT|nr:CLUMA_CG003366, isoform A [Clunio marinus]